MACPGAKIEDIRTVYSHPQALSQCAAFIRSHGWKTVECAGADGLRGIEEIGTEVLKLVSSEILP
jgi:prephenate dehydratase